MVSLQIEEIKEFTRQLFIGTTFDHFLLREAQIVTFNSFQIDGRIRPDYYSAEEREEQGIEGFSAWLALRPFCFSLIKGKRLPKAFTLFCSFPERPRRPF